MNGAGLAEASDGISPRAERDSDASHDVRSGTGLIYTTETSTPLRPSFAQVRAYAGPQNFGQFSAGAL